MADCTAAHLRKALARNLLLDCAWRWPSRRACPATTRALLAEPAAAWRAAADALRCWLGASLLSDGWRYRQLSPYVQKPRARQSLHTWLRAGVSERLTQHG